jgi:hypothetical protein
VISAKADFSESTPASNSGRLPGASRIFGSR